jgi:hypothetical protein
MKQSAPSVQAIGRVSCKPVSAFVPFGTAQRMMSTQIIRFMILLAMDFIRLPRLMGANRLSIRLHIDDL